MYNSEITVTLATHSFNAVRCGGWHMANLAGKSLFGGRCVDDGG